MIAGHTHCGGAAACYDAVCASSTAADTGTPPSTPLSRWLTPLTRLVASLDLGTTPPADALNVVIRENVKHQVEHVCDAEPVREAWAAGKQVWVHGWVYDVGSGQIKDLEVSRGPLGAHAQL